MKKSRTHRSRLMRDVAASLALAAAISGAVAATIVPLSAADVTIGANVNQSTTESGTCGFLSAAERPCTLITSVVPGQTMTAPCDGTVTRFRLNGFPRPGNHYGLRVVRRNADGSFTGKASSATVAITSEGVNEYPTSLPIAAGDQIGLDFKDSTEEHGVRWVGGGSSVSAFYFYAFPADGGSAQPTGPATFYYLFNADIACTTSLPNPAPPAPATVPSNKFTVVKLNGKVLTLNLASSGAVTVTDARRKAKALKPSGTRGGPGDVRVNLKLTRAAKKKLREKGKLKVRASIAFTPTGGTVSTQVSKLAISKRKVPK